MNNNNNPIVIFLGISFVTITSIGTLIVRHKKQRKRNESIRKLKEIGVDIDDAEKIHDYVERQKEAARESAREGENSFITWLRTALRILDLTGYLPNILRIGKQIYHWVLEVLNNIEN
ncbi:molecular chaperone GroEL [Nodularia spumigena]|jgi:D-alanyl-lipoteichoic acid acyltransferase DltB (MBOAT superfamily)|uniref:Molecular chaperone GroEL n=1 Tax=Nodularia spumigena UHCC 0060 TaxID=3110300 RepID=A0ABU5US98_NODSP|nr:molecular chaperone GroEL [Nodularia spumigena]MEA5524742.1 molecular chaperone GroEL [Nodularia spumigena UHCC 0143]MEA5609119.1 molecular chaperone GroEL [Nodularia spumigena UHCC 0060]MEA5613244.1 molecular chaperone GroEL [Nodularia spumigena UHCC 0040]